VLTIEPDAWRTILDHARSAYPHECCGALLGLLDPLDHSRRSVTVAMPCRNAYEGDQRDRFFIQLDDLFAAEKRARAEDIDLIGFFHSHPGGPAYFSATDLAECRPGDSNLVISFQGGAFTGAASFVVDEEKTRAEPEQLLYPE
jgi:proteasome lid subunit RPN8/RPN11